MMEINSTQNNLKRQKEKKMTKSHTEKNENHKKAEEEENENKSELDQELKEIIEQNESQASALKKMLNKLNAKKDS
jgi:hypothetical protein